LIIFRVFVRFIRDQKVNKERIACSTGKHERGLQVS
jgi:hypothetical protein